MFVLFTSANNFYWKHNKTLTMKFTEAEKGNIRNSNMYILLQKISTTNLNQTTTTNAYTDLHKILLFLH